MLTENKIKLPVFFAILIISLLFTACPEVLDNGFNSNGIYVATGNPYNPQGYDKDGNYWYDNEGYDYLGFNANGFNRSGNHQNGTLFDLVPCVN